jgi:hypothetical protein
MTVNAANLGKDLSQRALILEVRKPEEYRPDWSAETWELIDQNRMAIIGDILAELKRADGVPSPTKEHSRWPEWEAAVLSRCCPGAAALDKCLALAERRRQDVDGDDEEADLVRSAFKAAMKTIDHEKTRVFFTSKEAASIVNSATGGFRALAKAGSYLNTLSIPELRRDKWKGDRGWFWSGAGAPGEGQVVEYSKLPRT